MDMFIYMHLNKNLLYSMSKSSQYEILCFLATFKKSTHKYINLVGSHGKNYPQVMKKVIPVSFVILSSLFNSTDLTDFISFSTVRYIWRDLWNMFQ